MLIIAEPTTSLDIDSRWLRFVRVVSLGQSGVNNPLHRMQIHTDLPQIPSLSSKPSPQSSSPSQSHCLAMHLCLEQANWFHRHEESVGDEEKERERDGENKGREEVDGVR